MTMQKLGKVKSDRVIRIKNKLINNTPGICSERLRYFTKAYKENSSAPPIIIRAYALKEFLENVSLYFDDDLIIPGNSASHPRWASIFPEYSWQWVFNEIDSYEKRNFDRFRITPEAKAELAELLPWWKDRSVYERVINRQPTQVMDAADIHVLSWTGQATSGEGHIVIDYPTIIEMGFSGIRNIAVNSRRDLNLYEPDSLQKRDFYEAVEIVCDGVLAYITRLIEFLQNYIKDQPNSNRRAEVLSIIEDLRIVPAKSAKTFRQALLTVWFTHMILQIESNGHSVSLGRFDQYLFPFYSADIKNNIITEEEALELIEHFYLKLYTIIKLRPEKHSRTQSGYPMYQNLVVGGQTRDGKDATNALSYLCLSAVAEVRLSEPNFYMRLHKGTPKDFLDQAIEIVSLGFGMPAFVNDEIIIESLEGRNISHEDALDYSTLGCLEVQVPGKWGYRANGKSKVNMLKIMELVLNNGTDPISGKTIKKGKGNAIDFASFDEVIEAWRDQLAYYIQLQVTADNIIDQALHDLVPNAFCSMLVQDCLGRGKHLNQGGAIYDMTSGSLVGVPNVGDVLAAIKKSVFEEKTLTMKEIKEALDNNFQGHDFEEIRQVLFNRMPKYGNDDDYADELAALSLKDYCDQISLYKNMRYGKGPIGGTFYASTVSVSANITAGDAVGATPDGRKAFEPTADGISPSHGAGKNGPTAIFHSVTKLPTRSVTGGQLLNIRLQNSLLKSQAGKEKLAALLRAMVDMKAWHVQFNTVSTHVLRDAIKHPENYRDLIVRVAGYSALFVTLDPVLQMDIISRMEHDIA